MRRMIDGGPGQSHRYGEARNVNSQIPSATASDTGAGSGGDDGTEDANKIKDKNALTLEERENRYREARARIFKDFKEENTEAGDGANGANDKEVSRSSSASGVKKGKKHRKPKDDGFEARSAYSQYGNQTYSASGLNTPASDGSFYNPFAPYAMPESNVPTNRMLEATQQMQVPGYTSYTQQPPSGMNPWGAPHPTQGYPITQTPANASFHGQDNNFDPANVFSSSLQSYPSPNLSSQLTPKVATQSMYSHEYMTQPDTMGWSNGQNFANPYTGSGMMYSGTSSPDASFMANQTMYPPPPNPYGGFSAHEQQYYPQQVYNSAFNRQQFNPRSQVFTPSLRGGPSPSMQPNQNFVYSSAATQYSNSLQGQTTNASHGSGYSSPHFPQSSPNGNRMNNQNPSRPQAQAARAPQPGFPSSISKWGTPSTLPPKPPPPAIQSPFFEVPRDPQNQQPLPPNPYSNLVRPSSNNNIGVQTSR